MRILILSIILLLSGCYLGYAPEQYHYWIKPQATSEERKKEKKFCDMQSQENLSERDKALLEEGRKNWEGLYNRKQDYQYYSYLITELDKRYRACLYKHGYRFNAPIHWCFAVGVDSYLKTCIENMKYR